AEFARLGVEEDGRYRQLNANILQIENELYAPIRPKRVTRDGESPSDALLRGGVEYIEVRSLDINPFTPIGVDADQARFLDLFLIWCVLADAPEMSSDELLCTRQNWNRVILEGRKPGQTIGIGCHDARQPLAYVGQSLFADLHRVAEVLDGINGDARYQQVCARLVAAFEDVSLTYSARVMAQMGDRGIGSYGLALAQRYRDRLCSEPLTLLDEATLTAQAQGSVTRQAALESQDSESFADYLRQHAGR
ncbi:MAG: glutamate--cysteine ligase, partial [Edwardsiella sp. (in: enterobacteria)]